MPLSAKTVKDRAIKMAENLTGQQIKDINLASAFSIAGDESKDVSDIEQTALLCRYVNSVGPQKEIVELKSIKDQTRVEDICEALLSTNHHESLATDGAPSMTGAQKEVVTSEVAGSVDVSLHPASRAIVRSGSRTRGNLDQ